MADIWIQLSPTDRIIGVKFQPPRSDELDIWRPFDLPEERFDDYNFYRVRDNTLVFDPHQPTPAEVEEEEHAAEQYRILEDTINTLPDILSDTDAALCEIYEHQESITSDTDAALCEIYEMLIDIQEGLNG